MKKLINRVEDVLNEQLQGLAKAHPQLTLHQDPLYVTRTDAPVAGKVALLSGGGSGHEPMHCGYIGQGMLSGACPGEIFTSPTPDKMFECAMQIDGGEGVLLIIKNYTGDILNFETATELLHESGIKVTTVVVDDDVAVKDSLYTAGRRGVANTVLIEKLVGAAAERGDRAGGGNFGKRGAIFDELVDDGSMVPQIKADLGVRRKVLGKLFSEVDVRFDGKVAFGRHDAGSQNS